jgi:flagellar secretion chaperone FliS
MNAVNKYSNAQKETASRERLMVLLFEAALRHMRAAAASLENGQRGQAQTPLRKSMDIVLELDRTLDPSHAPELVDKLHSIYAFVAHRLLQAQLKHEPKLAREAERVFSPMVDAFTTAVASLSKPGETNR